MSSLKKLGKSLTKPFHSNTMKSILPTALATAGTLLAGPTGGAVGGGVGSMLTGGNTAENIGAAAGGYVAGIGTYAGQKMARNMFGKVDSGGVEDVVEEPIEKLETAKEDSIKRRRALYATKGGVLGAEVDKVGGTFGNVRGTLFGN